MQTLDDLLKDTLYQYIKKEHIDTENELTQQQWDEFINQYSSTFADQSSELAFNLLDEYKLNYLESKYDRKANDD
jgi:thiaminase